LRNPYAVPVHGAQKGAGAAVSSPGGESEQARGLDVVLVFTGEIESLRLRREAGSVFGVAWPEADVAPCSRRRRGAEGRLGRTGVGGQRMGGKRMGRQRQAEPKRRQGRRRSSSGLRGAERGTGFTRTPLTPHHSPPGVPPAEDLFDRRPGPVEFT